MHQPFIILCCLPFHVLSGSASPAASVGCNTPSPLRRTSTHMAGSSKAESRAIDVARECGVGHPGQIWSDSSTSRRGGGVRPRDSGAGVVRVHVATQGGKELDRLSCSRPRAACRIGVKISRIRDPQITDPSTNVAKSSAGVLRP